MKFDLIARWLPIVRRLSHHDGRVGLSYDDGPTPEATPGILKLLSEYNAGATFFLSGCRTVQYPDLVADIVRAGHPVYAHGWDHIRLDHAGPERLKADLLRGEELLARFRPTPDPYLVRLPYAGGYRNPKVHRTIRSFWPSAQIAHWSLHVDDPGLARMCKTPDEVRLEGQKRIDAALDTGSLEGAVMLLHDMAFDIDSSVRAETSLILTEQFLKGLAKRGLRACPMDICSSPSILDRFLLL